jgi:hypothetical protein
MAERSHPSSPGSNESCRETRDIDLRDSARYAASIEWIRNHVVLRKAKGDVLQLNVSLPAGAAVLYMNPVNHYIMAFRGADKIYVLEDNKSETFRKSLQEQLGKTQIEILKGLGADHGLGGLRTFTRRDSGVEGRVFARRDLDAVAALSSYSNESRNLGYDELRAHLSLLVCMIPESARIPMMERDFGNMLYYGYDVWADDAIRSYDSAKFLIQLARQTFPQYPRDLAVEKLAKRAKELGELLEKIESESKFSNRSRLITQLITGKASPLPSVAGPAARFREMCKELKIHDAATVSRMISTCGSEGAVRAAMQGVAAPDIGKTL